MLTDPNIARITLARVLRPHGCRGEVAAEILTDFPERLRTLASAWLWDGRTEPRQVAIRSCWLSTSRGGQAIFHFAGSDSISDAEKLARLEVQVPLEERMPLPAGSYYITDLVGCEVWEHRERIGTVRDVQPLGSGTPLLAVDTPSGELLIPLADEICVRVDPEARRIDVRLPEGLREINQR